MSRVEVIGDATLYLGDCREILPTLPRIEAMISDPPYGNSNHDGDWNARLNEHRRLANQPIANDTLETMREVLDSALHHVVALLPKKASACCCFVGGGGPRPGFAWLAERMDREGLSFFHSVIWDKRNPGLGQRFRRQHEMILFAHREGGTMRWAADGRTVPNIVSIMPPREREHPNEKPLALMEWCVETVTNAGDLVLDPFMGSATTGVACLRLGRKFIGIELDEAHFETACRRIEAEHRRPRLPLPEPRITHQPDLLAP